MIKQFELIINKSMNRLQDEEKSTIEKAEEIQIDVENSICIILFGVILFQAIRTSRIPYIIALSLVFILSNASMITRNVFDLKREHNLQSDKDLYLTFLFLSLAMGLRLSGHWWFTFEYVDCSITLPYAFKQQQIPKDRRWRLTFVYCIVTLINFLLPIFCFYCLYKQGKNS